MAKVVQHDWHLLGGGGGWEIWECRRCHLERIPLIFGWLWPWPRCANPADEHSCLWNDEIGAR